MGAIVKGVRGVGMTLLGFVNKAILNTTIYIRFAGCVATARCEAVIRMTPQTYGDFPVQPIGV